MKKDFAVPKGIIFDLDGTLLDSLLDIALSLNLVLEKMGLKPHPIDDYRYYVGSGVKELLRRALPEEMLTEKTVTDFTEAFRNVYYDQWKVHTKPYPGILNLLDELAKMNIKMAVLSNKPHDFTCRIVENRLPVSLFDRVRGAKEDIPVKPHPEGAVRIAADWNIAPENIFFVGDTAVDIETARNAGMVPVGVSWGFRPVSELLQSGAQYLLHHPDDLLYYFSHPEKEGSS